MKEFSKVADTREGDTPLLRKYNIPIEHLDFAYIKNCTNAREAEQILRILRSNEVGYFPELTSAAEDRLRTLNASNKLFRIETPVLKTSELEEDDRLSIQNDLQAWISEVATFSETGAGDGGSETSYQLDEDDNDIPVRGTVVIKPTQVTNESFMDRGTKTPRAQSQRIKSWEYDKWDRFDVDAELTRLDIQDMQIQEWETSVKPKLQEEQALVKKQMKNADYEHFDIKGIKQLLDTSEKPTVTDKYPVGSSKINSSDSTSPRNLSTMTPSTISNARNVMSNRRVRIDIEDINIF